MVSQTGTDPLLHTARAPSFPRKAQATENPIPGTVAEPKAHPSGVAWGAQPQLWLQALPVRREPTHLGSSTNSSKQHSDHGSSYNTLREEQSILQGTPDSWPGKAQSHPSANSLCSVFNFNLSGTTGQLLKTDAFDMYSGGKHSHSAPWCFPARAHTSTPGCFNCFSAMYLMIKSSGL